MEAFELSVQKLYPIWIGLYTIWSVLFEKIGQGSIGFIGKKVQDQGYYNEKVHCRQVFGLQ